MSVSMYQLSVPVFVRMLTNLSTFLGKAAAHVEAKKLDPKALLDDRLYPDMFTLTRQVQIACDSSKGCGARLARTDELRNTDPRHQRLWQPYLCNIVSIVILCDLCVKVGTNG